MRDLFRIGSCKVFTLVTCLRFGAVLESKSPGHFVKRALIVGASAAALTLLLTSLAMYLELRYTENGAFMRAWAAQGAPDSRYGDPFDFLARWVRINEFLVDPVIATFVGLFIGFFSRRLLPSLIFGLAPLAVLQHPFDLLAAAAVGTSGLACWLGAKVSQTVLRTHAASPHT